ncbi:hypothetical protein Taro_003782 [Colocasia esculenta]|uniref:Retrotransposon Copia-like N-terminal domain-containing protein n=1 Tax=Colocasia esculenta TaxID=4460 RepID=A0A843TPT8_COLES|nr:hypothetical protein [Colocasia esculenta]
MSSSLTCVRLGAWTLAAVLLQILGLSLFMFAFFPMRPALSGVSGPESYVMPTCDSADFPEERDLPPHELKSLYNVVDGLPAEFILGKVDIPSSKIMTDAMPYTHTLLSSGRALAYHAIAAAPTVTMPRLKAIVSGGIGGFLDVAFNFNTKAMLDDNLIDQFYRSGLKMVMLGDETWIKLFPGRFTREDGVSSFYVGHSTFHLQVKDTVEVDFNVSRHLKTELAADDWNLLILHYLGLDHVGHIGGRNSVLMAPKLKEMDDVIMMIDRHTIMHQNDVNKHTLLVVVSDHGMTDHGNHGGSSYEETDCLALFVGLQEKPASSNMVTYKMVNQVDIAPTLALLFGLPIPRNNVGVLIQEVFDQMSDEQRLRALELNSWQLLRLLQAHLPSLLCQNSCNNSLDDARGSEISESTSSVREILCFRFSNAVKLHNFWKLQNGSEIISKRTDHVTNTVEAYYGFLRSASGWLSHAATNKAIGNSILLKRKSFGADGMKMRADGALRKEQDHRQLRVFLSGVEHHALQITLVKLNKHNCVEWSPAAKLYIGAKRKSGYVNGKIGKLDKKSPDLEDWVEQNNIVMSWLVNSVEDA